MLHPTSISYCFILLVNNNDLVFKYHSLCRHDINRLCFYDVNYLCLCDTARRAECLRHDPSLDFCQQCLAGGHCFQGNLSDKADFICLCPRCYYGSICQYDARAFSFTLESLLANDISSPRTSVRITAICSYSFIILFLFCAGLLNNLLSGLTFQRPKHRLIGTGYYLLCNSLFAQFSLLWLMIKIALIILSINNIIT